MDSTPLKPSEQAQRLLESTSTKEVPPVLSVLPQTKAVLTVVMDSTQKESSNLFPIPVGNSRSPEGGLGTQSLVADSCPCLGSRADEAALSESPKPVDAVNAPVVTQNSANEPLLQPTAPIPARETPIIPLNQTQMPPEPPSPQELLSVLSEDISSKDSSSKKTSDDDAAFTFHQVRRIAFNGRSCAVITQNKNGPCPMLALANVLLLRGELSLPEGLEIIDGEEIIARLSNYLFSQTPERISDEDLPNHERRVSDALNAFPSLQTGLDINVRFTGVTRFEYTSALDIFDLFKIGVYHGWVVDPSNRAWTDVIQDRTYNQLVEAVIGWKSSEDPDVVNRGFLAEAFLESTASQLTKHGLRQLADTLRNDQLGVFFRNNHFSTIYRRNGLLYTLLTDVSFANEPNFVWETLNNVDGNTQFVDANFKPSTTTTGPGFGAPAQTTTGASPGASNRTPSAPPRNPSPSSSLLPTKVNVQNPQTLLSPTAPSSGVTAATSMVLENVPKAEEDTASLKSPSRLSPPTQPAGLAIASPEEAGQRQVQGLADVPADSATTNEESDHDLALRLQKEMLVEASKGLALSPGEDPDFELACKLLQDEINAAEVAKQHFSSDYELAVKLHQELNLAAVQEVNAPPQQLSQYNSGNEPTYSTRPSTLHSGGTNQAGAGRTPSPRRRASDDDCTIV